MNTKDNFIRMFRYDRWANLECLNAVGNDAAQQAKVVRLLAHIVAAQKVWLDRVEQVPQSVAVWPEINLADCSGRINRIAAEWIAFLERSSDSAFAEEIEYRNSKGERWASRAEDIVIHALMHSAYHRGQVAIEMRATGSAPAYTDFIHGVRQGLIG